MTRASTYARASARFPWTACGLNLTSSTANGAASALVIAFGSLIEGVDGCDLAMTGLLRWAGMPGCVIAFGAHRSRDTIVYARSLATIQVRKRLTAESDRLGRCLEAGERHCQPQEIVGQLLGFLVDSPTGRSPSLVRSTGGMRRRADFDVRFRLRLGAARAKNNFGGFREV